MKFYEYRKGYFIMWIEELTNSKGIRYKYIDRFKDPNTRKWVRVSVTLNSKNRQAKKAAAMMLKEKFHEKTVTIAEKRAALLGTLTMYQVLDEWYEFTRPTVKITTARSHRFQCNVIKRSIPSSLLFVEYTPAMAETLVNSLYYEEGLSHSYCKCILSTIKGTMRYAKKKAHYVDDIQDFEEIELVKRPTTPEELQKKFNKFLDRGELASCLSQLREINERICFAMEFIALTGLRCGEMLALRIQDYDRGKSMINVNGTLVATVKNCDDVQRGTPKNVYSYRDVYLNERAKHILDWFIMENKKAALWTHGMYKDRGYIFTTKWGNPYHLPYINRLLRRVHIPNKQVSTHIFRHTHISLLTEEGLDLKSIMKRVGHHNPNTTLSIYTHVTEAMNEAAKRKIDLLRIV